MFSFKKKRLSKADFSHQSFSKASEIIISLFFIAFFLKNPDVSLQNVKQGMKICTSAIIPNIFPFMVASDILVRTNGSSLFSVFSKKIMNHMFGLSGESGYALFLGAICGFPIGTKTAMSLYIQGRISKEETEKIISFCNYPSPAFLINIVGLGMWSNKKIGILLYISVLISGIICGIFQKQKNTSVNNTVVSKEKKDEPFLKVLNESVASSSLSMLMVCSYIIFFSCVIGCLAFFTDKIFIRDYVKSIIFSFFELTAGTSSAALISPKQVGLIICAAASSWSGLSVHMQNTSICSYQADTGISMKRYYVSKLFQSIISPIILSILAFLIPTNINQSNSINAFLQFNGKLRAFIVSFFIISAFYTIIRALLLLLAKIKHRKIKKLDTNALF